MSLERVEQLLEQQEALTAETQEMLDELQEMNEGMQGLIEAAQDTLGGGLHDESDQDPARMEDMLATMARFDTTLSQMEFENAGCVDFSIMLDKLTYAH